MNKYFEQLKPVMEKAMALQTAMTLFQWDNETGAPKEAGEYTAKVIGTLSDEYYQTYINEDVEKLIERLQSKKEQETLTERENAIVKEIGRIIQQLRPIPKKEYKEFSTLTAKSSTVWAKAKQDNDYKAFAPVLKEIIEYQKRFAKYRKHGKQKLYDVMLNDFEPGFNMETLDIFFNKIKTELVPFIKKVERKMENVEKSYEFDIYPVEKQREFCDWISSYLGFNKNRGIILESAHPFTTNLHNHDVRYTNHYEEKGVEDSIFSAIHETGHALYEFGVRDEFTLTPVGTGTSMGMHESQSRFFENVIGKTEAFWTPIYGRLVDMFPEQLKNVSLKDFIKGINKSKLSLIRTQADELTYPLHILVRYEMEKEIFENGADVEQLPKLWNEKYKEYLSVEPESDTEGILQDIHWAGGDFGYFPSYALGSAIAAQIYYYMKGEMPFEDYLKEGNLLPIREFLKEKVHQYGKSKTTNEILKEMTGEEFNADYYIKYLKEKYHNLYHINE